MIKNTACLFLAVALVCKADQLRQHDGAPLIVHDLADGSLATNLQFDVP